MDTIEVLQRLCGETAPSGFEGPAVAAAAALLRPYVDEIKVERLQSVVGVRRCGKTGAKKLLLDAHLDEIGFLITGVEEGFLRFRSLGGVDQRMLPAREVTILTEPPILGVVATKPPHLQAAGESDQSIPMDDLRIDVGMSQEEAERVVPVGTPAVYRESCFALGNGAVCGKAMDDRACFAILLRTMELLQNEKLDVDVYVLGSSCEEVGGRGALTAVYDVAPDFCVAVDVTHGATPDEPKPKGRAMEMGGGPAIGVGPVVARWMSNRMKEKAEASHIPYQIEVMAGSTGTNGDEFQTAREGIATAVLSLPLKYMHTPVEVAALDDMEQTAQLLAAFVRDLGKEAPEC